jgi:hypothetical protein
MKHLAAQRQGDWTAVSYDSTRSLAAAYRIHYKERHGLGSAYQYAATPRIPVYRQHSYRLDNDQVAQLPASKLHASGLALL